MNKKQRKRRKRWLRKYKYEHDVTRKIEKAKQVLRFGVDGRVGWVPLSQRDNKYRNPFVDVKVQMANYTRKLEDMEKSFLKLGEPFWK